MSEFAKLCSEAIKEDLKKKRAAVKDEAGEARKIIRNARRIFANYKGNGEGYLRILLGSRKTYTSSLQFSHPKLMLPPRQRIARLRSR
ncbi:unnamed protein product [Haemonchus placei]|uniref:Transposase n=1 Tax=Haemonchus placei TaxID=6290 RepID=A0A0N4WVE9_HAEPC|nr:unnamed protein product [Haemonchus placei]